MGILLVIPGVICLLVGLVGCFLPILPGPPVAYLTLRLLYFTGYAEFMVTELIVWGLLAVLTQATDCATPTLGIKYSGESKWGNWGRAAGTVAGMFMFSPWRILLGPLVGELLGGKASEDALKTGFGVFTGFLLGVVLKVALYGHFIYSSARGIINWRW